MKKLETILFEYLALRRSLGFDLTKQESPLKEFVAFFKAQKAPYLTNKLALKWARLPRNCNPAWWTDRLGMLRGFASHWKNIEPRTQVPPNRLLLSQYKRPSPYIYSNLQIAEILEETKRLPTEDRYTYFTLFGLVTATGMRIGEALALHNEDVDIKEGIINVHESKLNKSRLLPLHKTTLQALKRYIRQRDNRFPVRKNKSFFAILDGRCPSHAVAWKIFKQVLINTDIQKSSQKKGPRIHDLRHTFAVNAMIEFYQNGDLLDRKIHALSIYLGHKDIQCTYWYLTAVPELMSLALSRLEQKIGGMQ
jgi:integrase